MGDLTSSSVGVAAPGRLPRISSSASVPCQCAVQPPERRPSESAAGPVHSRRREERLARRGCPARGGSRARHEDAAISRLYLAFISPVSRLYLGYLSPVTRTRPTEPPSPEGRRGRSIGGLYNNDNNDHDDDAAGGDDDDEYDEGGGSLLSGAEGGERQPLAVVGAIAADAARGAPCGHPRAYRTVQGRVRDSPDAARAHAAIRAPQQQAKPVVPSSAATSPWPGSVGGHRHRSVQPHPPPPSPRYASHSSTPTAAPPSASPVPLEPPGLDGGGAGSGESGGNGCCCGGPAHGGAFLSSVTVARAASWASAASEALPTLSTSRTVASLCDHGAGRTAGGGGSRPSHS